MKKIYVKPETEIISNVTDPIMDNIIVSSQPTDEYDSKSGTFDWEDDEDDDADSGWPMK